MAEPTAARRDAGSGGTLHVLATAQEVDRRATMTRDELVGALVG